MVLDASKTNHAVNWKSIARYVQNYPREMQTNSLILAKTPQTNENKSAPILVLLEMVLDASKTNPFRCK
jgi:hypothetical protein